MNKDGKIASFLFSSIFCLQTLLLFLVLAESKLVIPFWLQPVGRLHPIVLHLPIGFFFTLIGIQLIRAQVDVKSFARIQTFLIYLTSLASSLAALMGMFLAQENGYDAAIIKWHKWTGIIFSFLMYFMIWQNRRSDSDRLFMPLLVPASAFILLAGHLGGELTHGKGFIWSPLQKEKYVSLEDSSLYTALIKPILEGKCTSCHNELKAKGELVMTSKDQLLQGGKNGALWAAGDAEKSLILQRLHLPISEKEHMPPRGKPQPTQNQVHLLMQWIKDGADFDKKLKDYSDGPSKTFYGKAIEERTAEIKKSLYEFAFAKDELIQKLNTPFCTVSPIAANSPALSARIFIRDNYDPNFLYDLLQIKDQLVTLDLSNLPIQDTELKTIGQFNQLEKLNLNGTEITGATLGDLTTCKKLKELSLACTEINVNIKVLLEETQSLEQLYVWNTNLETNTLDSLESEFNQIAFDRGFIPDSGEVLQLTPPILGNGKLVVAEGELIYLQSLLPGVIVRYTTDGKEPDSVRSRIYEAPIPAKKISNIRARAFAKGWIGSETVDFRVFKTGYKVGDVRLIQANAQRFPGSGPPGLVDLEKGNARETLSPLWLGFQNNPLEAVFEFNFPVPTISELVISYALNIDGSMLPPQQISIYGKDDGPSWHKLKTMKPQVENQEASPQVGIVSIGIPSSNYQYYRMTAEPYKKLPSWHDRKGKKGWLLVDEIFFY